MTSISKILSLLTVFPLSLPSFPQFPKQSIPQTQKDVKSPEERIRAVVDGVMKPRCSLFDGQLRYSSCWNTVVFKLPYGSGTAKQQGRKLQLPVK